VKVILHIYIDLFTMLSFPLYFVTVLISYFLNHIIHNHYCINLWIGKIHFKDINDEYSLVRVDLSYFSLVDCMESNVIII